jgi:hypothetical protein
VVTVFRTWLGAAKPFLSISIDWELLFACEQFEDYEFFKENLQVSLEVKSSKPWGAESDPCCSININVEFNII